MKTLRKKILPLFLCLFMALTCIGETSIATFAAQLSEDMSLSENSIESEPATDAELPDAIEADMQSELPADTAATDETAQTIANPVTVTFLNTDGTELLPAVTLEKGTLLNTVIANAAQITPVRKGYELYKWAYTNAGRAQERTPASLLSVFKPTIDCPLRAIWRSNPYDYVIQYQLDGGEFAAEDLDSVVETPDGNSIDKVPKSFTVESPTLTLCNPIRKDYRFEGWYLDNTFLTPITVIPGGTYIDSDANGIVPDYNLYAKWTFVKPAAPSISSAKNTSTGVIKVTYDTVEGAQGYELLYSTDKNFKKNVNTIQTNNQTSFSLTNLPKGKTYYMKLRSYAMDSTHSITYSDYSSAVSCKVTKGVKEFTAKKNSGKLKSVQVKNTTDLYVTATVSKRLKSSDESYYLVKTDPVTGKITKAVANTSKTKKLVFQLPLWSDDGTNLIQGKYGIAIKKGKSYMLISSASYISNPEAAASYTGAFPTPASKKGRQGKYESSMGDKNYFFNFDLNSVIASKGSGTKYNYNGKTYYFNDIGMKSTISSINEDGGTVTMQVMLTWNSSNKKLILKSGRRGGAKYYAFNTEEKAAREQIEAAFCYLAEEYGKADCHIDNWIVGNEVNTFQNPTEHWYYAGNISRDAFIKNYASTFRILYYAVKSQYKNGRVYICSDHTWINREQDWGSKNFMTAFNNEIKSQNKNIQWNLAYHCYSAVLTNADFWNDGSLATSSSNTDFVSPNNLSVMTNYVKENFGKNTRIILSEQGFSHTGGTGSPWNNGRQTGESVQAAAVAYLYYKAQFNDMIDAVIYNAVDNGTSPGFHFGLTGRKAEDVYRYMDTPKYATYTKGCLSTIGKSSWKNAVPNFSDKKLKSMPNR